MTNFSNKLAAKFAVLGLIASAMTGPAAIAQDAAGTDIRTLTCWEVVTLHPDDRISAMTLIYGYAIGSKGKSVISPKDTQSAIETTLTTCAEKPEAKILDIMFDKIAKVEE